MEARARAAVARLQEVTAAAEKTALSKALDDAGAPDSADVVHVSPDEAETISRTLVLAQRTADATIADAKAEAERLLNDVARRVGGDARLDPRDVGQAARGRPRRGPQGIRGGAARGRERGAVARRPARVPRRRRRPTRAVPDRATRAAAHGGAPTRGDVRARAGRSRACAAARAVRVRRSARRRHRRALPPAGRRDARSRRRRAGRRRRRRPTRRSTTRRRRCSKPPPASTSSRRATAERGVTRANLRSAPGRARYRGAERRRRGNHLRASGRTAERSAQ